LRFEDRSKGIVPGLLAKVVAILIQWAPVQAGAQEDITCPGFLPFEQDLRPTVEYLTDERLAGRGTGTLGDACAARFIATRFKELGLHPGSEEHGFLQVVPWGQSGNGSGEGAGAFNVVAVLSGIEPEEGVILIGAHHDHLGQKDGERHFPGADDNASGVATLLRVAKLLAQDEPLRRTVVFVTFTGEEGGFLGSRQYLRQPVVPADRMLVMLNLDMVGRLRDSPLQVHGIGGLPGHREGILNVLSAQSIPVLPSEDVRRGSDQGMFLDAGIPALHFTTGTHADHHKHSDTMENIDFEGMDSIAHLIVDLIQALGSH